MKKLGLSAAAALAFSVMAGQPAVAQSTTPEAVLGVCSIVIEEQYSDERGKDGQCIAAVAEFLASISAPTPEADAIIAELVVLLAELYRDDAQCTIGDTELPEAIQTAAAATSDAEVGIEFASIAEQIDICDFEATAAIGDVAATEA